MHSLQAVEVAASVVQVAPPAVEAGDQSRSWSYAPR